MKKKYHFNISVIVPTYRRPEKLKRALESIICRDRSILDIIVIDDDPEMSAAQTVKTFDGVRYIAKRGKDRGLSTSRNLGVKYSSGSHIIFLDDDDFFYPEAIEKFISEFDPSKVFYFGNFDYLRVSRIENINTIDVDLNSILICNSIPVGSYMIQKSIIRYLFDPLMKSHEDWDFLLRNILWDKTKHIASTLVAIDKTSEDPDSMQYRRRSQFWLDYLSIYGKFPAPHLAVHRSSFLSTIGVNVPAEALTHQFQF